jgi:hypothetical protein
MLARRVIALSPDKAFAKQLGTWLKAAGGAVETHLNLEAIGRGELQAALVVLHLDGELRGALPDLVSRLDGDAQLVVVMPKHNLIEMVDIMRVSERISSVLIAEEMKPTDITAVAARLLHGDIFGLEKIVPWGTRIYSTLVGDYQEKSMCISQLSEFAELMGVRRKYREAVEQCVDEMLMNALYDAPVDEQGRQIFAEIPTRTRISLRMEQKVVVQYACSGTTFFVSVRDSFGTLERNTVTKYLHKCLHSAQQIDRKTGGAGLGLYLMANATTRFMFNVLPGVATECVCCFDLDSPKLQLETFGFFHEKIDAAGRLAAGPSRLLPAGANFPVERRASAAAPNGTSRSPRGLVVALLLAVAVVVGLVGVVAYPMIRPKPTATIEVRTTPPEATIEVAGEPRGTTAGGTLAVPGLAVGESVKVVARLDGYVPAEATVSPAADTPPVELTLAREAATVGLDTDPPGATVLVAGKEVGTTPISLTDLPPRGSTEITFRKAGYLDVTRTVKIPAPGGEAQIVQSLTVSADMASVLVTSTPPGAEVWIDGKKIEGAVTPTEELLVDAGKRHVIALKLARHMPTEVVVNPARGARRLPVTATLVAGSSVKIDANVDGRATVSGVKACTKRELPFECPLTKGKYTVEIEGQKPPGKATRTIVVADEPVEVKVTFGFVEAPSGKRLMIGSSKVPRAAFEEGKRVVTVIDDGSGVMSPVEVRVQSGKTARVP